MSIMNWSLQIQQKQKNPKDLENEKKKKNLNKKIHSLFTTKGYNMAK